MKLKELNQKLRDCKSDKDLGFYQIEYVGNEWQILFYNWQFDTELYGTIDKQKTFHLNKIDIKIHEIELITCFFDNIKGNAVDNKLREN